MIRKRGRPLGRRYDSALGVKVTKSERAAYAAAARRQGMSLSLWVRQALRRGLPPGAPGSA